jgi:hypothetical protein
MVCVDVTVTKVIEVTKMVGISPEELEEKKRLAEAQKAYDPFSSLHFSFLSFLSLIL